MAVGDAYELGEQNPYAGQQPVIQSDTDMFFAGGEGGSAGSLGEMAGAPAGIFAGGGSRFGVSLPEWRKNNKAKKRQAQIDAWNSPQAVQARIARAQWNDFKERYVPVENKFMELVRRGEPEKAAARGVANADVAQSFDPAARQLSVQKVLNGDQVGSAGNTLAALDAQIAKSVATGESKNNATRQQEQLDLDGRQKVVSLGRGLADDANLGLRTSAVLSARDNASRAAASAHKAISNASTAGAVVGAFGQGALENGKNPRLKPVEGVDADSVGKSWVPGRAYDEMYPDERPRGEYSGFSFGFGGR